MGTSILMSRTPPERPQLLGVETLVPVQVFRQHAQREVAVARHERALDELRRLWCTNRMMGAQRRLWLPFTQCDATPACRAGSSG